MTPYRLNLLALLTAIAVPTVPTIARTVVPLATGSQGIEKIEAVVSGRRGTFLFDSGIGTSAVTPAVAEAIGCKPWGKVTGFRATGERLDLPRCNGARVAIGPTSTTLPQLSVIDLARFMGPQSAGLSGVLGLDTFAGQVVTLDVAHHQFAIEDAASLAEIRRTATEVPIRLVRDAEGAALTVDVGVSTSSGMTWMELDTGNYGPSMVDKSIAGLFGLDAASAALQQWRVPMPGSMAVSGPVVVKDLILDGNLGRNVLSHWLVTLDLAAGRGWIRTIAPQPT
ncbi:MAG: aspartyl protease family protein [Janthinobacterium lividum]